MNDRPRGPVQARGKARVNSALLVAALLGWWLLLRPGFLGGPAGYVLVTGGSMRPALAAGDLLVVHRTARYRTGDVIAYRVRVGARSRDGRALVVHRVVGGSPAAGFVTRGDARAEADLWRPRPEAVVGRMVVRVPRAGMLLARLRDPLLAASLAATLCLLGLPRPAKPGAPGPTE